MHLIDNNFKDLPTVHTGRERTEICYRI